MIPEADWKRLRQLQPELLSRFCQRVLDQISQFAGDSDAEPHERYLQVYEVIYRKDKVMRALFDDITRSKALARIRLMKDEGLFEGGELEGFSEDTKQFLER